MENGLPWEKLVLGDQPHWRAAGVDGTSWAVWWRPTKKRWLVYLRNGLSDLESGWLTYAKTAEEGKAIADEMHRVWQEEHAAQESVAHNLVNKLLT